MINQRHPHYEFPFSAIVGQDLLKIALLVNAIIPRSMGVLIRGQKGTAKSTAVRAMANILPRIRRVAGCPFNCDPDSPPHLLCESCIKKSNLGIPLPVEITSIPLVTLPLNATEDNLAGSINFEAAIKSGAKRFLPGLLAKAHRGILYVDEVNLLDDNLIDLLLVASAGGINIVEREGISYWHLSEFILIGTMNPEEGELRPQFLDRFGLCVQTDSLKDVDKRVEIMKRYRKFIEDPESFRSNWYGAEVKERQRIENAMSLMENIRISTDKYSRIIEICNDAQVSGHRADIIIERAVRAIAAYNGREEPGYRDIDLAASLALPHRIREKHKVPQERVYLRTGMDEPADQIPVGIKMDKDLDPGREKSKKRTNKPPDDAENISLKTTKSHGENEDESMEAVGGFFLPHPPDVNEAPFISTPIPVDISRILKGRIKTRFTAPGRRYCTESIRKQGRYIRATVSSEKGDIAFDATIRAAAPFQNIRPQTGNVINILPDDIRTKVRKHRKNLLLVFVVDASGSIGHRLMSETKGAIFHFLKDAYIKRDKVCLIAFRNNGAEILLQPTYSIDLARKILEDLPTGGRTPLCAGMLEGYNVIRSSLICSRGILPLLVLLTDGRANVAVDASLSLPGKNTFLLYEELFSMAEMIRSERRMNSVVIDIEPAVTGAFRMTEKIAEKMGAKYVALDAIKSVSIARAVCAAIELPEYDRSE